MLPGPLDLSLSNLSLCKDGVVEKGGVSKKFFANKRFFFVCVRLFVCVLFWRFVQASFFDTLIDSQLVKIQTHPESLTKNP